MHRQLSVTLLLATVMALAQTPDKVGVSSVRMNPRRPGGMVSVSPYGGATFTAENVTLALVVQLAFGVDDSQISGEARLGNETYNIAVQPENGGKLSYERLKPLLRQMLADRFKLATHEETKEMQGYELTLAKGGPKLKANRGAQAPAHFVPSGMSATGITTDTLAGMLARPVGRPVVNRTGIEGSFDVQLSYADPRVPGADTTALPAVFTAVEEQLGLKLEPRKVPLRILVIDSCERVPAEN